MLSKLNAHGSWLLAGGAVIAFIVLVLISHASADLATDRHPMPMSAPALPSSPVEPAVGSSCGAASTDLPVMKAELTPEVRHQASYFGFSVATAGDVNGVSAKPAGERGVGAR